jgi:hypothetical protein
VFTVTHAAAQARATSASPFSGKRAARIFLRSPKMARARAMRWALVSMGCGAVVVIEISSRGKAPRA